MISHRAKNTILSVIFYGCPSVFTFCGGVFGFTHGIWWALGSAVAGLLAGYLLLTVLFFCLLPFIGLNTEGFFKKKSPNQTAHPTTL